METLQLTFNYQQLDTHTRLFVQHRTDKIKVMIRRTAQDIIEIGENLIEVKERLGHGHFGTWLESEFGWSQYTAINFMRVADKFRNFPNLDDVAPSALYLLAAPSTPDEARQEAIERARNGEVITHQTVKTILGIHKTINPLIADTAPANITANHIERTVDDFLSPDLDIAAVLADEDNPYNYKRDNRRSVVSNIYAPQGMDACQTPAYALDPLLPYLPRAWVIWEPAAGEGLLVEALYDSGYSESQVKYDDILTGQNFFDYEPEVWDCIVTNPPYSIQFQWLERCYQLGKPFALLLKVEILGTKTAQEMFDNLGVEVIFVSPRINFKMPHKGWDGGGAQFPTAWFTYGLNIGQQMKFAKVVPDAD